MITSPTRRPRGIEYRDTTPAAPLTPLRARFPIGPILAQKQANWIAV